MFQKRCAEKKNTYFSKTFPEIFYPLRDNVDKFCTAGQATDNNKANTHACWITKAADRNTNLEYVILIAFPTQQ